MNAELAGIVTGAISCIGVGYVIGRWIKTIRQFFDSI